MRQIDLRQHGRTLGVRGSGVRERAGQKARQEYAAETHLDRQLGLAGRMARQRVGV
jgi:hypothetical protein